MLARSDAVGSILPQKRQSQNLKNPAKLEKPMVEYALAYAAKGFPVIALWPVRDGKCTCWRARKGKDCGKSTGKHPITDYKLGLTSKSDAEGFEHLATTDPARIRQIWRKYPDANIGFANGDIFSIDVDNIETALKFLEEIKNRYYGGNMPDTVITKTGSGGYHIYYKQLEGVTIDKNSVSELAKGVDIRTAGGLSVVPPSMHYSGNRYQWLPGYSPFERDFGKVPEELAKLIKQSEGKSKGKRAKQAKGETKGKVAQEIVDKLDGIYFDEEGKVIPKYLNKLDVIFDGERNRTVFADIVCSMQGAGYSDADIMATALAVNATKCIDPETGERKPMGEDEVIQIVTSALQRYPKGKKYPLTDYGNAERLIDRHGQDLRYCMKTWFHWDEKRWVMDETLEVERRAKETVRAMPEDVEDLPEDHQYKKAVLDWAKKSESRKRIMDMIALARSEKGIAVSHEVFDTDPYLLNVENGTIDLRTGELKPHNRDDMITKLAPVVYDPNAQCPLWEKFLNDIFAGNQELIKYIQKVIGYSLTGSTKEEAVFFFYGKGKNGKSTLIETIEKMLGDYAQTAPPSLLVEKKNKSGANNDEARLKGARFVTAVETEEGQRFPVPLLKRIASGDRITARFLNKEYFTFKPEAKLIVATNDKPILPGGDYATWRRIHLVPFKVQIPKEKQDPDLKEKLKDEKELSGILRWAVEGCLKWQAEGLNPPEEVIAATKEYQHEMDSLGHFIEECTEKKASATIPVQHLFKAYLNWAKTNGIKHTLTRPMLSKKLKERGFEQKRYNTGMHWVDVTFTQDGKDYLDTYYY